MTLTPVIGALLLSPYLVMKQVGIFCVKLRTKISMIKVLMITKRQAVSAVTIQGSIKAVFDLSTECLINDTNTCYQCTFLINIFG